MLFSQKVGIGSVSFVPASSLSIKGNASVGDGYELTAAPTDGLIVKGNVGIGTTTVDAALKIFTTGTPFKMDDTFGRTLIIQCGHATSYTAGGSSVPTVSKHVFSSSGSLSTTAGTTGMLEATGSFAPGSGTGIYNTISATPTINQTGGASGVTRGLYINPTLTAAADWRAIETANSTGFAIYTAGTATSYFGGNVGIGTTTPAGKFHVNNDVIGTDSAFVVLPSGRVGIGTTSPSAGRLLVQGVGNNQFFIQLPSEAGSTNGLMLTHSSTGGGIGTYHYSTSGNNFAAAIVNTENDALHLATNNSPRITIDQNGLVGFGTTSPGAYLDINPTYTGATVASLYGQRTNFTLNNVGTTITNWYGNYIGSPTVTAGTLTNKYALVTEANAGNVGIGTTSPLTTLSVSGGLSMNVRTITASYTVTTSDYYILSDAAGGALTITMPAATNKGQIIGITRINAGGGPATTIQRAGADTFKSLGVTSFTINTQWNTVWFIADGTSGWYLMSGWRPSEGSY